MLFDLGPRRVAWPSLLLPYDDLAVVRAGRENVAVFRVRPGNLPYGTCMSETESRKIATITIIR